MSTRRSRLQIKPNIGGPKGLPGKAGKKKSTVVAPDAATDTKADKVASPRNTDKSQVTGSKSDKPEKDLSTTDETQKTNEIVSGSASEAKSEIDSQGNAIASTNEESVNNAAVLPTRARLRRFGKVNLSIARGATDTVGKTKAEVKEDTPNKLESKDCTEISKHVEKSVQKSKESNTGSEENVELVSKSKESKAKEITPRRSRFPKAKPNVLDAGKRRPKQTESTSTNEISVKENTPAKSSKETTVSEIPAGGDKSLETIISTAEETNLTLSDSESQLTQIQPKPALPRSPLKAAVNPSLVSSPIKQAPGSEKRVRTVSTTEAPVVKKAKKPKCEAPTDKPADRTSMRMRDLIHWNPTSNPMKLKEKPSTKGVVAGVEKENVDKAKDVPTKVASEPTDTADTADSAMAAPQVTIGPDGNIVINERSLVIDNPDKDLLSSQDDMVIDETDMITTYASFRKKNQSKRWTKKETAKFYKVLGMIGIDFFLIHKLFPDRSRHEIKKKFKREEKKNGVLIEKVLEGGLNFDPTLYDGEPVDESSEEEEVMEKKKEKTKRGGKKEKPASGETKPKAKRQTKKPRKKLKNYYEDSLSEEEIEEKKLPNSKDTPWQPPSVSQTDGEVVDILVDMSKGRLPTPGQTPDNMSQDSNEVLRAIPVTKPYNMLANTNNQSRTSKESVTKLPGIQSIITMKTEKRATSSINTDTQSEMKLQTQSPCLYSSSQTSPIQSPSVSMYENIGQSTSQHFTINNGLIGNESITKTATSTQASAIITASAESLDTEIMDNINRGEQSTAAVTGHSDPILQQANTSEANTKIMRQSSSQFQFMDGMANGDMQIMSPRSAQETSSALGLPTDLDNNDQYVLVTVVPEGSDETVIHIYRVHGGGQSSDQDVSAALGQQQLLSIPDSVDTIGQQVMTGYPDVENT